MEATIQHINIYNDETIGMIVSKVLILVNGCYFTISH